MQNAAQTYFQTQLTTIHQGDIVVMLFETAIRHLNHAKEKIAEKDMAGKGILISKALDVIHGLDASLNLDKGEDLAQNLRNLYTLCTARLLQANLKASPEIIDGVLNILEGLKDAFTEVLNDPAAQAMAQQMTARSKVSMNAMNAKTVSGAPRLGVGKTAANSAYAQVAKNNGVESTVNSNVAAQAPVNTGLNQKGSNDLNPLLFQSALSQKLNAPTAPAQTPQAVNTQVVGQVSNAQTLQTQIPTNVQNLQPQQPQQANLAQQNQSQQALQSPLQGQLNTKPLQSSQNPNPLSKPLVPTLSTNITDNVPVQSQQANSGNQNTLHNPLKKNNLLSSSAIKLMQG